MLLLLLVFGVLGGSRRSHPRSRYAQAWDPGERRKRKRAKRKNSIEGGYEVDHKKYTGEISLDLCGNVRMSEVRQFTLHKNFPVAYDTKFPAASRIILSLASAEHFNYKMPDSLYPCLRHLDCDYYLNVKPEDYSK